LRHLPRFAAIAAAIFYPPPPPLRMVAEGVVFIGDMWSDTITEDGEFVAKISASP
jgi:hypothetical protein